MDSFLVFLNPSRTTYALELYPHPALIRWSPPHSMPTTAAVQVPAASIFSLVN
jgi:hypothetical protein